MLQPFKSGESANPDYRGFTLLEMVVVMAIVALLVAIITPAMSGMIGATGLTAAGNMVENLASQARQMAMTKNTATALVILGDTGGADDFRKLSILEYVEGSGWKPATSWQTLPSGVIVDFSNRDACTFVSQSAVAMPFLPKSGPAGTLPVDYNGTQLTAASCAVRVFLANGGLHDSESPARVRLVEGVKEGGGVAYRHAAAEGGPGNYYDVSIVGATGMTKTSRPNL